MDACLANMSGTVKMSNVYHQSYYALLYIYTYDSFILMHLLLVSLNTNNAIINIGFRLLIKCILILMLSYRLIVM